MLHFETERACALCQRGITLDDRLSDRLSLLLRLAWTLQRELAVTYIVLHAVSCRNWPRILYSPAEMRSNSRELLAMGLLGIRISPDQGRNRGYPALNLQLLSDTWYLTMPAFARCRCSLEGPRIHAG